MTTTAVGTTGEHVSEPILDLLDDGLIAQFPEGQRLLGALCNACGRTMLGRRSVCSSCVSRDIARVALPTTGVLYSFTRLHFGETERALGYVDLGSAEISAADLFTAVRTLADIRETAPLLPGMRVELGVDSDGWFFAPTGTAP